MFWINFPQNLHFHFHLLIVSELIVLRWCKFSCHAKFAAPKLALPNPFGNYFRPNLHFTLKSLRIKSVSFSALSLVSKWSTTRDGVAATPLVARRCFGGLTLLGVCSCDTLATLIRIPRPSRDRGITTPTGGGLALVPLKAQALGGPKVETDHIRFRKYSLKRRAQ